LTSVLAQVAPSLGSVAAVGGTGVATGTLTGEVIQDETTADASAVSGLVTVKDPVTGLPASTFTTNANGEVTIQVEVAAGQSSVAVVIGGETVVVDLADGPNASSSSTSTAPPPEIAFDYVNFMTPETSYKSTATLTPDFGGTPTGTVAWTVLSVTNPTAAWWLRGPAAKHGLVWGPTPAPSFWADAVIGTAPTGPTAQITDVIGDRSVTVQAIATVDGSTVTKVLNVAFGHGPMSVFSGPPASTTWATSDANTVFPSLGSAANYPYANMCGGFTPPPPNSVTANPSLDAVWGAGWWTVHSFKSFTWAYLTASKLPSVEQVLAVATPGPDSQGQAALYASGSSPGNVITRSIRYEKADGTFRNLDVIPVFGQAFTSSTLIQPLSGMCLQ
jgi:hypothetical protein